MPKGMLCFLAPFQLVSKCRIQGKSLGYVPNLQNAQMALGQWCFSNLKGHNRHRHSAGSWTPTPGLASGLRLCISQKLRPCRYCCIIDTF